MFNLLPNQKSPQVHKQSQLDKRLSILVFGLGLVSCITKQKPGKISSKL